MKQKDVKMKLLVDGKNAFPQIIECIQNARKTIHINMFIWRDDSIGNVIATELLKAADRDVKITISKDSYGTVCEHCEESGTSFFHKKVSFTDAIKIGTLKLLYHPRILKQKDSQSDVYKAFIQHPNITVETSFKADHSKFYIFDDEKLIFGGINIEDKENGRDMLGREYQDYMIMLCGAEYVSLFKTTFLSGTDDDAMELPVYFGMNVKTQVRGDLSHFQMEQMYLDLINEAEEELTVVMAYFSPRADFISAICGAVQRGVKVTLVIPGRANFQDDSNRATALRLWKLSGGRIKLYFSPKMLHTKLLYSEKLISFGSCNITRKAFRQLNELNCFIRRGVESVVDVEMQLIKSVQNTIEGSLVCTSLAQFKRNLFLSFCEQLIM